MTDEELIANVAPYDTIGPTPVYTKYQVLQMLMLVRTPRHEPCVKIEQLIAWLSNEEKKSYGASRTHDLHLWDWEVSSLKKELAGQRRELVLRRFGFTYEHQPTCNAVLLMNEAACNCINKPRAETPGGIFPERPAELKDFPPGEQ